ncbi:MAG: isoprenylcysteine carboxylmethyltransferase family protein [Thermoanaerobaculia bacterium]
MTLLGVDTRVLYLGLIGLVVLERLAELVITRRNAERLRARGGFEAGRGHYTPMVVLHTGLLIAAPLEVWTLGRPLLPALAVPMLLLLAATMSLRYWAIASLGDRWTTQVFVVPGEAPVRRGPYRWLRHPNYLAVVFEVAALPLIHTAWWTALVVSIGNAWVLRVRIRTEEEALVEHSNYEAAMADLPRLMPGGSRDDS